MGCVYDSSPERATDALNAYHANWSEPEATWWSGFHRRENLETERATLIRAGMLGVYRRVITPGYPGLCCRFSTRTRRFIPGAVRQVLEANYRKDRYPTREQFEEMSRKFGQSYERLYEWYYDRRCQERKTLDFDQVESHPLAGTAHLRISTVITRALEAKYHDNYCPTHDELEKMSRELGKSYDRLYNWFILRYKKLWQMATFARIESHQPPFSTAVAASLEANYIKNRYPTCKELEKMARELGERFDRVVSWYYNRRVKERKLLTATGTEEQPGEFAPHRLDLRPYWPRLEAAFQQDLYPTVEKIKLLAEEFMVPRLSIAKWFAYRRIKERVLREKAGLETTEFKRIGLTPAKARHLQEFLDRTLNLHPSQTEVHELARRAEVPVGAVRSWFSRRREHDPGKPGRPITRSGRGT